MYIIYNYYYIVIIAFIYYIISKLDINKLIAIIIILLIGYVLYNNILKNEKENELKNLSNDKKLYEDVKDTVEISTSEYFINNNPNNIKYLKNNKELVDIINNLSFIKKFNKSLYSELIVFCNKLMKIYMYILSNRYDIYTYQPIFIDIRNKIIELLYSLIFVVPDQFKHIYGLNPYDEINKSTRDFIILSKDMLNILEKYGKIEKKVLYLQDSKYKPYNMIKDNIHNLP